MKRGILIGETDDGEFIPLALPDKDVVEQRAQYKAIQRAGGEIKGKGKEITKLVRVMFFDTATKEARFRK